jgi:hypothetical protein
MCGKGLGALLRVCSISKSGYGSFSMFKLSRAEMLCVEGWCAEFATGTIRLWGVWLVCAVLG